MAEASLPDRTQAINCESPFPDKNLLDSATVKDRLEASIIQLNHLVALALTRDLTAYHPLTLSRYLQEVIGEQLGQVEALCKALWATCQGLPRWPRGRRTDA